MLKTLSIWFVTLLLSASAWAEEQIDETMQKGAFNLKLTMIEVGGEEAAGAAEVAIAPDEPMSFEIYVPDNYQADKSAGLMVYVSPTPWGKIPRRWKKVLDEANMLWIAANNSGNKVPVARRAIYAIVAPTIMKQRYNIDPARVYISGFSGGGKVASMIAPGSTNLFKGALYNCGVEFWEKYPHEDPATIAKYRYVFLSGSDDFNLKQTRRVHNQYLEAGVENSKLIVVRRMGHRNPPADEFRQAIEFLDVGATLKSYANEQANLPN